MKRSFKSKDGQLLELLRSKYSGDHQGFRSYMPEVAQMLDAMDSPRRPARSPFGLTEQERDHYRRELAEILESMVEGVLTAERAITGLRHCATLIRDDSLPEETGYETLVKLLKSAIGKSPGSFKKPETIRVADRSPEDVVNSVSLVRGVSLGLDREARLVSISVSPHKVSQRRKMLAFVGIGRDTEQDVALRHDEYLAEQSPHAAP